ncbi:unnamed protein product [Gadus morhua 'NCC']
MPRNLNPGRTLRTKMGEGVLRKLPFGAAKQTPLLCLLPLLSPLSPPLSAFTPSASAPRVGAEMKRAIVVQEAQNHEVFRGLLKQASAALRGGDELKGSRK